MEDTGVMLFSLRRSQNLNRFLKMVCPKSCAKKLRKENSTKIGNNFKTSENENTNTGMSIHYSTYSLPISATCVSSSYMQTLTTAVKNNNLIDVRGLLEAGVPVDTQDEVRNHFESRTFYSQKVCFWWQYVMNRRFSRDRCLNFAEM